MTAPELTKYVLELEERVLELEVENRKLRRQLTGETEATLQVTRPLQPQEWSWSLSYLD